MDRLDIAENRISNLEDRLVENIQMNHRDEVIDTCISTS